MSSTNKSFNILALDGGGSKGVYTLGYLIELEAHFNKPLHECFDLIYGVSTGSIITALLSLGYSSENIFKKYMKMIPPIMCSWGAKNRTDQLKIYANEIFNDKKFSDCLTNVGIVATDALLNRPMIFKSSANQAHGLHSTFVPGFGVKIADAVVASCSAVPFFLPITVNTVNQGDRDLFDGVSRQLLCPVRIASNRNHTTWYRYASSQ